MQRAAIHVQSSGREEVTGANVLVAIFSERESHAVYFLQEQDMSRLRCGQLHLATASPRSTARAEARRVSRRRGGVRSGEKVVQTGEEALDAYCVNLNEKAKAGKIDPLIGRDAEVERTIQVLCRRTKNNPLYVGEPGVGKTAIAEGLARRIVNGEVPEVLQRRHHLLARHGRAARRHALSRRFRGAAQGRDRPSSRPIHGAILFIDEIHTVIGAGATSGGAMDASNLLKPALQSGTLRCIGSTTYKEYRTYFEKDRALVRRFQKIDVNEPTIEDAVKILRGLKPYYEEHHKVRYTAEAIRAAVELAARYINDRKLPDKAIDVIDEVGASQKLLPESKRKKLIDGEGRRGGRRQDRAHPAEDRVAQRPGVAEEPRARPEDDRCSARTRRSRQLAAAIKLARAGLREPEKPIGCLPVLRPDRRRQDRGRAPARADARASS